MLSKEERRALVELVRNTIDARLKGQPLPRFTPSSERLSQNSGAFVTLHKKGALRGCIGYVEAIKPIYQSVQDMALAAACQGRRFPPLQPPPLPPPRSRLNRSPVAAGLRAGRRRGRWYMLRSRPIGAEAADKANGPPLIRPAGPHKTRLEKPDLVRKSHN